MTIHRAVVLPSGFHNTGKLVTHNDHLSTRAAPKVKPLVWKNPFCTEGSAAVSFGIYYFMWDEEVQSLYGSLELGECENPIILDPSNCASAQEVMAVCQADYERRILDALE